MQRAAANTEEQEETRDVNATAHCPVNLCADSMLRIPASVEDIDREWVSRLVGLVSGDGECEVRIISLEKVHDVSSEGVLSDVAKIFVHASVTAAGKDKKPRPVTHNFFVKVVPTHLVPLVKRHKLFEREIIFYR